MKRTAKHIRLRESSKKRKPRKSPLYISTIRSKTDAEPGFRARRRLANATGGKLSALRLVKGRRANRMSFHSHHHLDVAEAELGVRVPFRWDWESVTS